jgi:hypothetical protein
MADHQEDAEFDPDKLAKKLFYIILFSTVAYCGSVVLFIL